MMTNEEAHEFLEELQRHLTLYRKMYSNELIKANGKAIEALEKQIPQAMQRVKDKGLRAYICPVCGNPFAGNRYCDRCGQRLEW